MAELLARRTYSSKTHDLGGGVYRLEAHAGHIHYRDSQGDLQDVNFTLVDRGTFWSMEAASYRLYIVKDFAAADLLRFENRFEGAAHVIYFEPRQLVWVNNPDLSDMQVFRSAAAVQGVVTGNTIRWANAFGNGLHFEVTLRRSGFTKELVIQAKNRIGTPPTTSHRLAVLTRYRAAGLTLKASDLEDWDNSAYYESSAGFSLRDGAARRTIIREAYVRDSAEQRMSCRVFWKLHNGDLWQAKILPQAAIDNGTYPLRADTVTNFYSGAGDGYAEHYGQTNWDTAHNATDGAGAGYGDTTVGVQTGKAANGNILITRLFLPFDTSAIGSGSTVNSATLYVYPFAAVDNGDNDGDDFVSVVQTTQASETTLAVADYDTCGSTHSPTEGASRRDLGTFGTGAYESFSLDATGLTWVSKTGYTKLGLREGHDILDSAYAGANNTRNRFRIYMSEQTGTSNDPYLAVDYTPAATGNPWYYYDQQ